MSTLPNAALRAVFALFLAACGGGSINANAKVEVKGRAELLSATAVKQKCEEAAKGHDRPFVVEWDATDLASFEAKAQRDTILVHYEGCKLDVLYECSDNGIAGKFGAYGPPQFTSGTVQGFDVKNEGELYAKLPLGAVSLSGRVAAGETLHLKYFVTGVAISSRDSMYRSSLAAYPGCKTATHFVWSYNLGAFELGASANQSVEGEANAFGASGGGKAKHEESSLANGGSIASCTTQNQLACRVPIRLALRKINDEPDPAGGPGPMAGSGTGMMPPPGGGGSDWQATPAGQASASYSAGLKKLEAGDGAGCLADFDRALKLDAKQFDNYGFKFTRARCLMRAGKCDQGIIDLRATIAAQDTAKIKSDEQLDAEVRANANLECPSSTAKNDADFVERASNEITPLAKAKDIKGCQAKGDAILAKLPKLDKKKQPDGTAHGKGIAAVERASICVSTTKCNDGLPLWRAKYKMQLAGMSGVDKIADESWGTMIKTHPDLKGCK